MGWNRAMQARVRTTVQICEEPIMSEIEKLIRERAYQLWERAGRPTGHSDHFWFEAKREIEDQSPPLGGRPAGAEDLQPEERTLEEPPEVEAEEGMPIGQPGERIAEQGVLDDRLADIVAPRRR
jgi:hypothetical protein